MAMPGKEIDNDARTSNAFSISRRDLDTAPSTTAGALSRNRSVLKSRDLNQSVTKEKGIARNSSCITDMLLEDILIHSN